MYGYDTKVVGKVTIPDGVRVEQHYEVAAWYTLVDLVPGTYDVVESTSRQDGRTHWSAYVPARIVENWTPALFGGAMVHDGPTGRERNGEMTGHSITFSEYYDKAPKMSTRVGDHTITWERH